MPSAESPVMAEAPTSPGALQEHPLPPPLLPLEAAPLIVLPPALALLLVVLAPASPSHPTPLMESLVAPQSIGQSFPVVVSAPHSSGPQSVCRCMMGVKVLPASVETPAAKPSTNSSAQAKRPSSVQ